MIDEDQDLLLADLLRPVVKLQYGSSFAALSGVCLEFGLFHIRPGSGYVCVCVCVFLISIYPRRVCSALGLFSQQHTHKRSSTFIHLVKNIHISAFSRTLRVIMCQLLNSFK